MILIKYVSSSHRVEFVMCNVLISVYNWNWLDNNLKLWRLDVYGVWC